MSRRIQCERCGGEDFRLESGFYFCSECQLQSQDIQEQFMDEFYAGTAVRTTRKPENVDDAKETLNQTTTVGGKKIVSSVEILNYILKGLVDELILLGAPAKLNFVTLQLWATYLRKIEVAFTSTTIQKKPKFGLFHRKSDANRFYKTGGIRRVTSRKTKKKKTQSQVSSDAEGTSMTKKRRLFSKKRTLAQAEYEESHLSQSSMELSQTASHISMDLNSVTSKEDRLKYSKESEKIMKKFLEQPGLDKEELLSKAMSRQRDSIKHPKLMVIIPILRIALILSGSEIHLGDLHRWAEEGYLSLRRVRSLIPSHITLNSDQRNMTKITASPQRFENISNITRKLVNFLSIKNGDISSSKLISDLVKRYCKMLNLPDTISRGVDELLRQKPPKLWLNEMRANFEGRALALILFSLKILIGLNDATEYSYVPRKGEGGVKWEEWCRLYESRMGKKSVSHHPTNCRLYPNSYVGRHHSLLSHWNTSLMSQIEQPLDPVTRDSLHKILKPLICKLPEPVWQPGLMHEAEPTGPLLAVLSERSEESDDSSITVNILKPNNFPRSKFESLEVRPPSAKDLIIQVLSDTEEESHRSSLTKTSVKTEKGKYPSEKARSVKKIHQPTVKEANPSTVKTTVIKNSPEFPLWVYHSKEVVTYEGLFNRIIADKLPCSFTWLLTEMANMVYQTPHRIYSELVRVEKVFTTDKPLAHW